MRNTKKRILDESDVLARIEAMPSYDDFNYGDMMCSEYVAGNGPRGRVAVDDYAYNLDKYGVLDATDRSALVADLAVEGITHLDLEG